MDLWRSSCLIPLLRAGSNTAGFSGLCPVGFGVFSGLEAPPSSLGNQFQCSITLRVQKKLFSLCSHEIFHAPSPFAGHD